MRRHDVPVAIVGVSWRGASTETRAQLAALAGSSADPVAELRAAGYLSGAVCLSTCSRTEWLVAADEPEWAASLLRGSLLTRAPELAPNALHVRSGKAALHYVLRVAVGLDSVAEGESSVGRQLLKAFASARTAGTTDRSVRLVWKQVERLIRARRNEVPAARSVGVQSLVRDVLRERRVQTVAIVGRGEFGQAMERALQGRFELTTWSRTSLEKLRTHVNAVDAVVVCTGAAAPWLELAERDARAVCIDAGSPPQVRSANGWTRVGLDDLLSRPELHLTDVERDRLEQLVQSSTELLVTALSTPTKAQTLAAIDAQRTKFLNDQLPALLEGLPREQVKRVRQAVGAFAHAILQQTREVSS